MAWIYAITQYDNWVFLVFLFLMSQNNITAEVHATFILNFQKTVAYAWWYILKHMRKTKLY